MATSLLNRTVSTRLPTAEGEFQLIHYANAPDQKEHLALVMGHLQQQQNVLVRVHSECFTGDVLGSRRCDCGEQLHAAMQLIAAEGQGLVIYLRQEGRGIGLQKKLEAYNLQDQGHDTVDANLLLGHQADERTYEVAVAILRDLGVQSLRLITNNPSKLEQLRHAGLTVTERVPLVPTVHAENRTYLATKVARMRHLLALPPTQQDTPIQVIQNGVAKNGHAAPPLSPSAQLVANLQEKALAHFARYRLPFVTLSYAQSLDGSIAAADGTPLRISGERAMTLTHMLRAAHDAILVGVGTVLADDPQLTVRLVAGSDPQPILLDTHLRTPVTARCLRNPRPPWLVTAKAAATAAAPLRNAGARVLTSPCDAQGRIALQPLLRELASQGIRSIMVEGGATVLQSFLQGRLAHAAVITVAPFFVGGLPALATQRAPSDSRPEASCFPRLVTPQWLPLGDDIICHGYFQQTTAG